MNNLKALGYISATPLFSGLDESLCKKALDLGQTEHFSSGESIISEGSRVSGLGILLSGKAKVYKSASSGKVLMSILNPGAMLGAASIFVHDGNAPTDVIACGNCELIFITESDLMLLMENDFRLAVNYIKYLTERIRFLTSRIENIGSPAASEKLMNFLNLNAVEHRVQLPYDYTSLAESLCIGHASLYRVMDELETEGKIRRKGRTIYILNEKE